MGCGHEASTLSGGGLLLTTAKLITTGVRFPRVGEYDMPRRAISGFGVPRGQAFAETALKIASKSAAFLNLPTCEYGSEHEKIDPRNDFGISIGDRWRRCGSCSQRWQHRPKCGMEYAPGSRNFATFADCREPLKR
jgi:hypothetical protein